MKQFHIKITDRPDLVINLNDNEAIKLKLQSNAKRPVESKKPQITFQVTGMRWDEGDFYYFNWGLAAINLNDVVEIRFIDLMKRLPRLERKRKFFPKKSDVLSVIGLPVR